MPKREFLQLGQKYVEDKQFIGNYMASEKLDGIRGFWDCGISRGMLASDVPWANIAKDGRFKTPPVATGIWSRYGKVIYAPDWFLDRMPMVPVDGELWCGPGLYQRTASIVRTIKDNDDEWEEVTFKVFDSPNLEIVFADGEMNNQHFKKKFFGISSWLQDQPIYKNIFQMSRMAHFIDVYNTLQSAGIENDSVKILTQTQLPHDIADAKHMIGELLDRVLERGGEGLVLRAPGTFWVPHRTKFVLKHKPWHDDEGIVIGYKWAEGTDLKKSISGEQTDKLLGKMGALYVEFNGHKFKLSGFTDAERIMVDLTGSYDEAMIYGCEHPGEDVDIETHQNDSFPIGSSVTFKYRELTDDGIPKEARYWRKRDET